MLLRFPAFHSFVPHFFSNFLLLKIRFFVKKSDLEEREMIMAKKVSPFRLSSLLRSQSDPRLALKLFQNPNPGDVAKPFRYSRLSYDLMITKLGRAKMFDEMDAVLTQMKSETRFVAKEVVFCNVLGFYGRGRLPDRALRLYEAVPEFGCQRTVKSLNSLLNALVACREFERLRAVVESAWEEMDACSYNVLIKGCVLRSDLGGAQKVFDEMRERGFNPNTATFATLISGLCGSLGVAEGFRLKEEMATRFGLKPNVAVYTSLIKGLFSAGDFESGLELKEEMISHGLEPDAAFYTTMFAGLVAAGRKKEAAEVLDTMKRKACKFTTSTYNAVITGLCGENDFLAARKLLDEMEAQGCKPDVISYNVIISGLCRGGKWREAKEMFNSMARRGCQPDVVSYRTLFDGLCDALRCKEAALVLDQMALKSYAPRAAGLSKLVTELCKKADAELLWSVWSAVERLNVAVDVATWRQMVSKISDKDQLADAAFLMDTLLLL